VRPTSCRDAKRKRMSWGKKEEEKTKKKETKNCNYFAQQ